MVQMDVVGGLAACLQFNCFADHKSDGLSNGLCRTGATRGLMQHLVCLVHAANVEIVRRCTVPGGWRCVRHSLYTECGGNALSEDKLGALGFDEGKQAGAAFSHMKGRRCQLH